jgi:hypothetical protein
MQYVRFPTPSGASQAEIEIAVLDALEAFFPTDVLGAVYHAAATTNIPSTFVEVGGAGQGTIPAGTKKIQVSSIIGTPLQFGNGANTAAAVALFDIVAGGGPIEFPVQFTAADILCVRTLDSSTVSENYFVINYLG